VKRLTHAKDIVIDGERLPINTTRNSGCYIEILDALHSQMRAMLTHHCGLLVVGFDLHLHSYIHDNKLMSRFLSKIKKRIRQRYQLVSSMANIGHLWVREQHSADVPHFHVALFLDAKYVAGAHAIHELAESIWEGWGNPRPYRATQRTFMIHRDNSAAYSAAFKALSYYAKEATKGNRPPATNDYSSSRVRPKQTHNSVTSGKLDDQSRCSPVALHHNRRDCEPTGSLQVNMMPVLPSERGCHSRLA